MAKFLSRKLLLPIVAFVFLDLLAVGVGMGIPIFAILLGFVAGWFAPAVLSSAAATVRRLLRVCLAAACLGSGLTFLLMLIIWGPRIGMLCDPAADLANFGIPMILFEPRASFIGWLVLMIVISPVLQALTAACASSVRLAWFPPAAVREAGRGGE